MDNNSTVKYGGAAFALSGVFYLATFFTGGTFLYGVCGLIATILLAPSIAGLYKYYKQNDNSYRVTLGTLTLIVGAMFIVGLYWFALVDVMTQEAFSQVSTDLRDSFETFASAITAISIMFGNVIFVGTFLLALSGLQTASDPKWMSWVGVVGSIVTIPWFFFAIAPPILQIIPAFGFALVIVWMVSIGIRLYRG